MNIKENKYTALFLSLSIVSVFVGFYVGIYLNALDPAEGGFANQIEDKRSPFSQYPRYDSTVTRKQIDSIVDQCLDELDHAFTVPGAFTQQKLIYDSFERLNPNALLKCAERLNQGFEASTDPDKKTFLSEVIIVFIYRWASFDANALLGFYNDSDSDFNYHAFQVVARLSPQFAYEYAMSLGSNEKRSKKRLLRAVLDQLEGKANEEGFAADVENALIALGVSKYGYQFEEYEDVMRKWNSAMSSGSGYDKNDKLQLLLDLSYSDREKALELSSHLKAGTRDILINSVLERWMEEDVDGALNYLSGSGLDIEPDSLSQVIVNASRVDEAKTIAWMKSTMDTKELMTLFLGGGQGYSPSYPRLYSEGILDLMKELPASSLLNSQILGSALKWSEESPLKAMEWAQRNLANVDHTDFQINVARSLFEEGTQSVLRYLDNFNEDNRSEVIDGVLRNWPSDQLDTAWQWASSLENGANRINALKTLSGKMADHNFSKAIAIAETTESASVRDALYQGIAFSAFVYNSPDALLEFVANIENDDSRSELTDLVMRISARTDPIAAFQRLDSLIEADPENQSRSFEIAGRLANKWAEKAPEEAFDYLSANYDGQNRERVLTDVVRLWAAGDFERAYESVETLDDVRSTQQIANRWSGDQNLVYRHSAEIFQLIDGLPESDDKNRLFERLDRTISRLEN